jgi:ABC-type branched-subunit amino acid transport system substrate-binding protein
MMACATDPSSHSTSNNAQQPDNQQKTTKSIDPLLEKMEGSILYLLPLSGPQEHIGKQFQQAAELAQQHYKTNVTPSTQTPPFIFFDTEQTNWHTKLRQAFQSSIYPLAIIGPFSSRAMELLPYDAISNDIPIISLNNQISYQKNGVYIFGFTPEHQISSLLTDYVAIQPNARAIFALIPQSRYGHITLEHLNKELQNNKLTLRHIERYQTDQELDLALQSILPILRSTAGEKTLFLLDNGKKLQRIWDALDEVSSTHNIPITALSIGVWDDPSTPSPKHVRTFFTTAYSDNLISFNQFFIKTFQTKPSRITSLAFDATHLLLTLYPQQEGKGLTSNNLNRISAIDGVDGLFRFQPGGLVSRDLRLMTLTPEGPKPVTALPSKTH